MPLFGMKNLTADHCNRGLLLYMKLKEVSKSRRSDVILLLTVPPVPSNFSKWGARAPPRAPWGRRLWAYQNRRPVNDNAFFEAASDCMQSGLACSRAEQKEVSRPVNEHYFEELF